jgi:2-polyprenyl-3-methyl-5-hydroxy-6-metoxy-1,4-benzoquinol methylase
MNCIVCDSNLISVFTVIDNKKYWSCRSCLAKFLDKDNRIDRDSEKDRYLQHDNRIKDIAYRGFLSRLATPLKKKLLKGYKGLDYGCGHGPALADILRSDGFDVDLYDPFFFPNKDVLYKKYDFITCTEVVEHFFNPLKEFTILNNLLNQGGWLGVMTSFLIKDELFESWYYRKDPTHVVFYAEKTFEVIAAQRKWSYEIQSKGIVLFCKN